MAPGSTGYIAATKLSNHDEDRAASKLGKSTAKEKLAAAVLLTTPGSPYIYYGEELGLYGTKDKGNDYSEIEKFVTDKVSAIVCMGKDNEKIKTFFAGKVPVIADTHSIGDAVSEATRLAKSGDTVLLSPCCASFDLFKSYEDRGRQFKDEVRKLKK